MPETMNISIPEKMKTFVSEEVEKGGYSSASEYVRELIRERKQQKEKQAVETLLLDAIQSGDPKALTNKDWDDIRKTVATKLNQNK